MSDFLQTQTEHSFRPNGRCAYCGTSMFAPTLDSRCIPVEPDIVEDRAMGDSGFVKAQHSMIRQPADPIEEAVRHGEERAEREWAIEHGQPLPRRLWSPQCRLGNHIFEMCLGEVQGVCVGCNQTEEQIELADESH